MIVPMYTRIIKKIFNENERCRDVKTQKACEQGREANIYRTQNYFHITLHKYIHCIKAKCKELYVCRGIRKWFV